MVSLVRSHLLPKLNLTYTENYALNYTIKCGLCAISLTLVSVLGRSIAKKNRVRVSSKANPLLTPSYHALDDFEQDIPYYELRRYLRKKNSLQPILVQLTILLSSIGHFLAYLVYCIIPAILSSLGIIPIPLSSFLMFIISAVAGYFMIKMACPSEVKALIRSKVQRRQYPRLSKFYLQAYSVNRLNPFAFKAFAAFLVGYSLFSPLATQSSCLAFYTPEYGSAFDAYSMSTAFSRFFTLPRACPTGEICHIYSTLPEDAATSVILNIQTGSDIDTLHVLYNIDDDISSEDFQETANNKTATSYFLPIEWKGQRYVHSALIDGLQPSTPYYAQFFDKDRYIGEARFSTLPDAKMKSNITVVIGGDSSGSDKSVTFINHITQYNPDVIIIGGDIVYDNGNINCFYCWDYYLDEFSKLNTRLGRLVPLILAVGNHDIGIDHYQFREVDKTQNLLFFFFPQHAKPNTTSPEIPDPDERASYFYHRLGNTLHVTLDSGYLSSAKGEQTNWLGNISRKYSDMAKLATYHVPVFSGCFFNPAEYKYDSRFFSWIPVFEKYNYLGVFENHVHLFKRTFPLKYTSRKSGPGVVYFGDGAWGVNENDCYYNDPNPNITGVFAKLGPVNHVWVARISAQEY